MEHQVFYYGTSGILLLLFFNPHNRFIVVEEAEANSDWQRAESIQPQRGFPYYLYCTEEETAVVGWFLHPLAISGEHLITETQWSDLSASTIKAQRDLFYP